MALRNEECVLSVIETGSWLGESAVWFAQKFDRVWSIERDFDYYKACLEFTAYPQFSNLEFIYGYSAVELGYIMAEIRRKKAQGFHVIADFCHALFYLDAHWNAGNGQPRPKIECPLLDELSSIFKQTDVVPYILIDDAKYFTEGDPSGLHAPDQWPTLEQIITALPKDYYTAVHNDFIVSVPQEAREVIERWKNE